MNLIDLFLHLDKTLDHAIEQYHNWVYLILFIIIFCETGLVVTPFLPGDSLLFTAGMFAGRGRLNEAWLLLLLSAAAVGGDTVNYWIGHIIGPKVFHKENVRFLNKKHLMRAHQFYERYGGKTIIIARFVPIVRTFAPFIAGIGSMTYWRFLAYNIFGGVGWIAILIVGGYFLGGVQWIGDHLTVAILVIVFLSILPAIIEYLRHRKNPQTGSD